MVELSQLVGLFAGKLMEQQEVVEDILDSAVGTAVNVEQVGTSPNSLGGNGVFQ